MAGVDIGRDSRIITIASGGCNALSYFVTDPLAAILASPPARGT